MDESFLEEYVTGEDYDSEKKLVEETDYGVKAVDPTPTQPVVGGDVEKVDEYDYTYYGEKGTNPTTDEFGPGVAAETDVSETSVSYCNRHKTKKRKVVEIHELKSIFHYFSVHKCDFLNCPKSTL